MDNNKYKYELKGEEILAFAGYVAHCYQSKKLNHDDKQEAAAFAITIKLQQKKKNIPISFSLLYKIGIEAIKKEEDYYKEINLIDLNKVDNKSIFKNENDDHIEIIYDEIDKLNMIDSFIVINHLGLFSSVPLSFQKLSIILDLSAETIRKKYNKSMKRINKIINHRLKIKRRNNNE